MNQFLLCFNIWLVLLFSSVNLACQLRLISYNVRMCYYIHRKTFFCCFVPHLGRLLIWQDDQRKCKLLNTKLKTCSYLLSQTAPVFFCLQNCVKGHCSIQEAAGTLNVCLLVRAPWCCRFKGLWYKLYGDSPGCTDTWVASWSQRQDERGHLLVLDMAFVENRNMHSSSQ